MSIDNEDAMTVPGGRSFTLSLIILSGLPATVWAPPLAAPRAVVPAPSFPLPTSARARWRDATGAPMSGDIKVAVAVNPGGTPAFTPGPAVFPGSTIGSANATDWLQNARIRIGEIGGKEWGTVMAAAGDNGQFAPLTELAADVVNLRVQAAGPSWTKPSSEVRDATGSTMSDDKRVPAQSFADVYHDALTTLVQQNIVPSSATDQEAITEAIMESIQTSASSGQEVSADVQKAMMVATAYLDETGGGEENSNGEAARAFAAVSARTGGANFRVVSRDKGLNFSSAELYYLDKVQAKSWSAYIMKASGDEKLDAGVDAWANKMTAATDISQVNRDLPMNWAVLADHLAKNLKVDVTDEVEASAIRYTTSLGTEVFASRTEAGESDGQAVNEIVKDLAAAMYATGSYHLSSLTLLAETHGLTGLDRDIANQLIEMAANPGTAEPKLSSKPVNTDGVAEPFLLKGRGVGSLPASTAGFLKGAMGLESATNAQVVGFLSLIDPDLSFSVSLAAVKGHSGEAALKAAVWNTMPASDGVGIGSRFMRSGDFIDAAAQVSQDMETDPDGKFSDTSLSVKDQSCARLIAGEMTAKKPNLATLTALVANADDPKQVMNEVEIKTSAVSVPASEALELGKAVANSKFDRADFVRQMSPANQILYSQKQPPVKLGPGEQVGTIRLDSSLALGHEGHLVAREIGKTRDGETAIGLYRGGGWSASSSSGPAAPVGVALLDGDRSSAEFVARQHVPEWEATRLVVSEDQDGRAPDTGEVTAATRLLGVSLHPSAHVVLLLSGGPDREMSGADFSAAMGGGAERGELGEGPGGDPEPDPEPDPDSEPEGL